MKQVLLLKLKKQTSKNVAETKFKAMNSHLLNVFCFKEFEKIWVFFWKSDMIPKLHILKQGVVIGHGNNSGNHVYCGKMLR